MLCEESDFVEHLGTIVATAYFDHNPPLLSLIIEREKDGLRKSLILAYSTILEEGMSPSEVESYRVQQGIDTREEINELYRDFRVKNAEEITGRKVVGLYVELGDKNSPKECELTGIRKL